MRRISAGYRKMAKATEAAIKRGRKAREVHMEHVRKVDSASTQPQPDVQLFDRTQELRAAIEPYLALGVSPNELLAIDCILQGALKAAEQRATRAARLEEAKWWFDQLHSFKTPRGDIWQMMRLQECKNALSAPAQTPSEEER